MHQVSDSSYDEIIDCFEIYADLLLEHKAIGFEDPLYLTPEQQAQIMLRLFDFELCKNIVTTRGTSVWLNNTDTHLSAAGRMIEGRDPLDCMRSNWHADCVEETRPISYLSMSMMEYDCPEGQGDTVLVNLEDLYEKCPYKESLQDMSFPHPARGVIDLDEDSEPQNFTLNDYNELFYSLQNLNEK